MRFPTLYLEQTLRIRSPLARVYQRAHASAGRVTAALLASLALVGCATIGPKPWERDLMAKPAMNLDAAPVESAMDDHVYFSKEGTAGGRGFGGGGCGCN